MEEEKNRQVPLDSGLPLNSPGIHPSRRLAIGRKSKQKIVWYSLSAVLIILWVFLPHWHHDGLPETSENLVDVRIGSTSWFKCDMAVPDGVECGTIVVPLNYFNFSQGTSTLALARLNATKERRGTVFLNPGGPGGAGTRLVTSSGRLFAQLVGPHYDLVGFDPRGIGKTVPKTRCFPGTMYRQIFQANTVVEQGFTVTANYSDPHMRDNLIEQHRQFLTLYETQARLCAENMGDELAFMGTANVVRDIDFMTTAFDGEEANINFWGGSYGTLLGAYLVNMFPSRVGRVIIDGVANPVVWSNKETYFWPRDFLSSTEDTFQWFLRSCSEAGPDRCPLARKIGEPTINIQTRLEVFMDKLYVTPLAVPNARRPGFLTSGGFRSLILVFLERPVTWEAGAHLLAQAMVGDGTGLLNMLLPSYDPAAPDSDLARLAVSCLDSPRASSETDFPTPEEMADEALATIRDVSPHFGSSMSWGEPDGGCQFWPVKGPERYTGPWNKTLNNKILIISNTADPVTPIASGKLVHSLLANSSGLLVQNSPGHCSLALGSLCTLKAIQEYYDSGALPAEGTVCEVDEVPFPSEDDVTSNSKEDAELMAAAKGIRDVLYDLNGKKI